MPNAPEAELTSTKKRHFWIELFLTLMLLIGVLILLYWLFIGRFYVYTDDAYVHGNEVALISQVSSGVSVIYADETDLVEAGQPVVQLDSTDYAIRVEELKKHLANTVREVVALFEDAKAKEAKVKLQTAKLNLAEVDVMHRKPLVKTGAVSREEFETYETAMWVEQASLELAHRDWDAARAQVEGTTVESHPRVQEVVWQLRKAFLDKIRCTILAPTTGFMAKRVVQVGDQVTESTRLLYIVPLNSIWVNANYKETQLSKVRMGQKVKMTADFYGRDVTFHGEVVGFQPGSGNAFALLPPENAAGNWIKIIQRVPVRIKLDIDEIRRYPLFLGLSMRVKTDVHDQEGSRISQTPVCTPIYSTDIYNQQVQQLEEFDSLIDSIIQTNITVSLAR